jgi:hypothetical protein
MYLQNVANFVDYSRLILGRLFCKCPWPGEVGRERELLPLHVKLVCLSKCKKETKDFFKRPGSEKG